MCPYEESLSAPGGEPPYYNIHPVQCLCAPDRTRTCNLQLRKLMLCPVELRAHLRGKQSCCSTSPVKFY